MGSVAITYRVMPEDVSTDIDAIREGIRKTLGPAMKGMQVKDVAFGLRAILTLAVVDDASGAAERLEHAMAAIPGVGSVEAIDVTLV
ncbi:MAG TPA: elongation factor 1-beta [Thermoplasmata archaeon]|nr:elongation factor 1-beta [Thermoplasmata archaeon]